MTQGDCPLCAILFTFADMNKEYVSIIVRETGLKEHQVENTLKLLENGATIPFISRYRKESTGGMDEVQVTEVSNALERLEELSKRKETVLNTIESQDKLTPELKNRIEHCWDSEKWGKAESWQQ